MSALSLFDYLGGTDKRLEGISVDKNFKFDAVQQPRPVTCVNFRLFHFCHALVNSSRPREKTNKTSAH
jgi:hypothetical protein